MKSFPRVRKLYTLVAKEYVAACEEDQGVLVLRGIKEGRDAVTVNPYIEGNENPVGP